MVLNKILTHINQLHIVFSSIRTLLRESLAIFRAFHSKVTSAKPNPDQGIFFKIRNIFASLYAYKNIEKTLCRKWQLKKSASNALYIIHVLNSRELIVGLYKNLIDKYFVTICFNAHKMPKLKKNFIQCSKHYHRLFP